MNPTPSAPVATVDAQNPWLGLVSFTEETRGYFHGREEEVAELGRRVQRKLLTVLFGQSGLGKTSILQAGLVPRLRPEGFCPVYVRLDYDPHSPPPADQIKRALFRATETAGTWTQSGSAVAGETLWEFLHHRDDVLKDASGRTLTPILIFDQFEEIFTLAQSDDAGRRRAQEFLADLADLVENRPPASLEARIDRDEADAARFDFARADYRILISLREDYLAHLEGIKGQMPSVTQNRMRLARMTGTQAVSAVRAPAPELVGEAVAEAVVRFVAGGTDLARAEVEPSLLSLICRELNNTRLAQGHAEISADLLAGSRDMILSEFYERALADQPPGVRIFIEDEMLTESGFRESVAEERVRKGFAAAGATPEAVATLVNRRLLRVEDRLDMRRVEITHDVLCSVIAASRRVRHEREALEESRRQLELQREREAATQRALVRARMVAAVSVTLMLLAVASAIFGWVNLRRAQQAEAQTQAARLVTEKARSEAEKLVGFLLEDFYDELQPTGRLEIVGNLADKAVAYYEGLPPELVTPQTQLYRGMALVRKSSAQAAAGNTLAAAKTSDEARAIFEKLRAAGDSGEAVTLGLALAHFTKGNASFLGRDGNELEATIDLLRPIVATGRASRSTKLALADALNFMGHEKPKAADGIQICEESRKILEGLGALDLTDLTAASVYGDVTDTQSRLELQLNRLDESEKLARIVGEIAGKVLAKRPGDLRAMKNVFLSPDVLARVAQARHDNAKAEDYNKQSIAAASNYILFNPEDSDGWLSVSASQNNLAETYFDEGRLSEALKEWHANTELENDPRNHTGSGGTWYVSWERIAATEARLGHIDQAMAALAENARVGEAMMKEQASGADLQKVERAWQELYQFNVLEAKGDYASILSRAIALEDALAHTSAPNAVWRSIRANAIRRNRQWIAEAALRTGHLEGAVSAAQDALNSPPVGRQDLRLEAEAIAREKTLLGQALAVQGELSKARGPLSEAIAHYRSLQAEGASETAFRLDFARALYAMALAQEATGDGRAERKALLAEAASLLGGLSQEAQQMDTSKELIEWVTREASKAG